MKARTMRAPAAPGSSEALAAAPGEPSQQASCQTAILAAIAIGDCKARPDLISARRNWSFAPQYWATAAALNRHKSMHKIRMICSGSAAKCGDGGWFAAQPGPERWAHSSTALGQRTKIGPQQSRLRSDPRCAEIPDELSCPRGAGFGRRAQTCFSLRQN